MNKLIALALLLALAASACSTSESINRTDAAPSTSSTEEPEAQPELELTDVSPTTPILERLDLETPGASVESLISAYDDRDFVRAWFMFDGTAQRLLARSLNNLDFTEFRRAPFLLPGNMIEGSGEHDSLSGVALFARFVGDAANLEQLHVDLAGAQISNSEVFDLSGESTPTATVTVTLSDGDHATLSLTLSEEAEWRVRQIATDGVEFDDSDRIFLDSSCGERRIRVYPGADCPSTETSDWSADVEVAAEVERLRDEAGDDIGKQLEAAQQIQDLVAGATVESDEQICAVLQGSAFLRDTGVNEIVFARAQLLVDDVCPGTVEWLTDPPAVPPSGGEVGERTAYGRLDLSTPENAVVTIGDLFDNEAFMLFFFSLDAQAQAVLNRSINNLDPSAFVDPAVLETWQPGDSATPYQTMLGSFASLMSEASATELHLLDLSGPLEVLETTPSIWTEPSGEPVDAHVVEASSEALSTVYFLMIESPSGRWRVRQVALDPTSFGLPENERLVFIAS